MGRIKTMLVKRKGKEIMKIYPEKVKQDFEANKGVLAEVAIIRSKKLRNVIAGYLTRLEKQKD